MSTAFHIKKKIVYLVLVLISLAIPAMAAVDTAQPWHPLQQVAVSSSNSNSVDNDDNGFIDRADKADNADYATNANYANSADSCNSATTAGSSTYAVLLTQSGGTAFDGWHNLRLGRYGVEDYQRLYMYRGDGSMSNEIKVSYADVAGSVAGGGGGGASCGWANVGSTPVSLGAMLAQGPTGVCYFQFGTFGDGTPRYTIGYLGHGSSRLSMAGGRTAKDWVYCDEDSVSGRKVNYVYRYCR